MKIGIVTANPHWGPLLKERIQQVPGVEQVIAYQPTILADPVPPPVDALIIRYDDNFVNLLQTTQRLQSVQKEDGSRIAIIIVSDTQKPTDIELATWKENWVPVVRTQEVVEIIPAIPFLNKAMPEKMVPPSFYTSQQVYALQVRLLRNLHTISIACFVLLAFCVIRLFLLL